MACEHCAPTARELENLRQEMGAEFAATRQEIRAGFATLNRKADHMSDQQAEIEQDVQEIDTDLGTISTQAGQVVTNLGDIATQITQLQAQIAAGNPVDLTSLGNLVTTASTTAAAVAAAASQAAGMDPNTPAPSGN